MHTKLSHSLLPQGYMTTRLSVPNQNVNVFFRSTSGAVTGFASTADLRIKNLKAAFPELKGWASVIHRLVVDCACGE